MRYMDSQLRNFAPSRMSLPLFIPVAAHQIYRPNWMHCAPISFHSSCTIILSVNAKEKVLIFQRKLFLKKKYSSLIKSAE